jgi:membrane associated rhomboid family serine protease
MSAPDPHPLGALLGHIAAAAPGPWYPSERAAATGLPRDALDAYLDQLRLAGLLRLTDWVQGHGQGYALTAHGEQVLASPRQLAGLARGRLPRPATEEEPGWEAREPTPGTWERARAAEASLVGPFTARVTYALIALNLLWFVAGAALAYQENVGPEYLSGKPLQKVLAIQKQFGALSGPDVYFRGQWQRLLTACFVHFGLVHLGSNMLSLLMVGPLVERLWGSGRFLLLYLIAGVGGSCGMLLESPAVVGAGASGAIWGILASMVTWLFLHRQVLRPAVVATWRRQLLITFALNLYITFAYPSISKGGHFGGGLVGLLAALPLDHTRLGRGAGKALAWAALLALPVLGVGLAWWSFGHGLNLGPFGRVKPSEAALRRNFEVETFLEQVAPPVSEAARAAGTVFDRRAEPLLNRVPQRRDPAGVDAARAALAGSREELTQAQQAAEGAGPFATEEVERGRQVGLQYLDALGRLLESADACLAAGDRWTAREQTTLEGRQNQVARFRARWAALLGTDPDD